MVSVPVNTTLQFYSGEVPRGSFFMRVETIEFNIFIITQIVYVIITFKSIISAFSTAHIVYISTPTRFKCLVI